MKNNFILSVLIGIFCFSNVAFSQSFILNSKNIEILNEGNQINAYSEAISKDKDLKINSDKFIYLKDSDILKSNGNGQVFIKSKNLKIKYDNATLDQKNLIFTAEGNIEIFQINGDLVIKNNEIFYDRKKHYQVRSGYKMEDNIGNIHFVDSFIYEINNNLIKAKI